VAEEEALKHRQSCHDTLLLVVGYIKVLM
jgi:hypothetical protein